jgi:prepilin-type N-terminal cleavage/methylation domain-containing protein
MKPRFSNQRSHAMTLVEVLVAIAVLAIFAMMFLPSENQITQRKAHRINCVNNLKEIGLAYRIWGGDNNDKFPMQISITNTNGGTMELTETGNVVATFQIMSNELSTPRLLYCTADDDHTFATNFTTLSAKNISYFIGIDANQSYPQTILSGDDNFAIDGVPVKSGLLKLSTNAPASWTSARHHFAGNIGLADGSVQEVTQNGLHQAFQQTGITNRLAIP